MGSRHPFHVSVMPYGYCNLLSENRTIITVPIEKYVFVRLSIQQQETFSFKQQLELLKLNAGSSQGNETQEKLNSLLASLMADNDRAKASLEEKNINLIEQVARLKEKLRTGEEDLKHFQEEENSLVKKLSQLEASLQITLKVKEQIEQERNELKSEVERLQHKYQESCNKSVESQARISELVDRLEKAESTSILSHQQLAKASLEEKNINLIEQSCQTQRKTRTGEEDLKHFQEEENS
ncbi:hypothetical protein Btru_066684 [Bulinus truncatus]|nr:hypothetical protein Btru_066684 [Bulinus truncatus]